MTSFWKIAIPVTCTVLIGGAAINWMVHRGKTKEQNLEATAEASRMRAEHGDVGAESSLGNFYYYGQGVPQDYAQAFQWYGKAADQNDANAQRALGFMYQNGLGVPQDTTEALRWYRNAADRGDAKAQNALALIYANGQGVPQNYTEALHWFRKAVDQGYSSAQYNLGDMYFYGRGVPQDRAEADQLYHVAAAQGDEYAQRILGLRRRGLSTSYGFSLLVMSLACLFFLKDSLSTRPSARTPQQRKLIVAELLGLAYVGFSLFAAFGVFRSQFGAHAVYFARDFAAGIAIVVLFSFFGPKSAKIVLAISVALLFSFNLIAITMAHRNPMGLAPAIRMFWSSIGFLLGLLISSAIVRRLPIQEDRESAAS